MCCQPKSLTSCISKEKCQHTDPLAQCIKNAFPDGIQTRIQQKKRKEIERTYIARIAGAKAKKDAQKELGWKGSQPSELRSELWGRASTEAREGKKAYSGFGEGLTGRFERHNQADLKSGKDEGFGEGFSDYFNGDTPEEKAANARACIENV